MRPQDLPEEGARCMSLCVSSQAVLKILLVYANDNLEADWYAYYQGVVDSHCCQGRSVFVGQCSPYVDPGVNNGLIAHMIGILRSERYCMLLLLEL